MTDEEIGELMQVARDVRFLHRITVGAELEKVKAEAFGGEERKEEAFLLLAEGKSYREIVESVGVGSTGTISRWVGEWRDLGLVHPEKQVVLASPSLFGIA